MRFSFFLAFVFLNTSIGFAASSRSAFGIEERAIPFEEWMIKSPNEANLLNLFPGFQEPTVEYIEKGVLKRKLIKMMMYLTPARAVADKTINKINISQLIGSKAFSALDSQSKHKKISASEAMPAVAVAKKTRIHNFDWCNKDSKNPDIFLPSLEYSQLHMARPRQPWCEAKPNSACFESCQILPIPSAIATAVYAYNQTKEPGKDYGLATQSEVRFYKNEAEFGNKTPLQEFTQIKTPVGGVLEINIFYFDQILLYGKIIIILQPDPKAPQKTILTSFSAYGVRADAWFHPIGGRKVQDIIRGQTSMNTPFGILAGIPRFSQNAVSSLAMFLSE